VWTGMPSLPKGYGLTSTQHGLPGDGAAGGGVGEFSKLVGVVVVMLALCVQATVEPSAAELAGGAPATARVRMTMLAGPAKASILKRQRMAEDGSRVIVADVERSQEVHDRRVQHTSDVPAPQPQHTIRGIAFESDIAFENGKLRSHCGDTHFTMA
jgi:hypothetical protein